MTDINERISIQNFIETLLDENAAEASIVLERFSDLEEADLAALKENWAQVKPSRRRHIIRNLKEIAENDMLVCFDSVAMMALDDSESDVRANAIGLLWEYEKKCLIPILIGMLKEDEDKYVRAAAATGLGRFIFLGEMEKIPTDAYINTENALLDTINGKDNKEVRQHALEAASFSCHKVVQDEIRRAYASEDPTWVASAMFAMGRSADRRWADMIVENLDHPASDVQMASIIAAGELELAETREPLLILLESGHLAEDLHQVIVWSLSQIGGENVRSALEYLLEIADEEEENETVEFLESALENLEFNEGMPLLDMFDFELDKDDDFYNTAELDGDVPENNG
jgi:HEAT repeat protein